MKKFLIILILAMVWLGSNGQPYSPIQPTKKGGHTNNQFESFTLGSSKLAVNYRFELLQLVNNFLVTTGLNQKINGGNPLTENWISWIFYPERTYGEYRIYKNGYWNSGTEGNNVVPYWEKDYFEGEVLVFHFEGYELDLAKKECMNLLRTPFNFQQVDELSGFGQNQNQNQGQNRSSIVVQKQTDQPTEFVEPETIEELVTASIPDDYQEPFIPTTSKKNKKWLWIAVPAVSTAVATAIYLVANNQEKHSSPAVFGPAWVPVHRGER